MMRLTSNKPRTVCSLSLLGLAGLGLVALTPATAHAIEPFVDGSAALQNPDLSSGIAVGVADMNADGLDDLVRLDDTSGLEIEYQNEDGVFTRANGGDVGNSMWSMSIGDVDGNGYPDIFTAGAYTGLTVFLANDDGTSLTPTTPNAPGTFAQCSNFADIDNNGTLDLFVCHDDGLSRPMNNDGDGNFTHDVTLINAVSATDLNPTDNSGNYGTVWSDYDNDGDLDLYIAKCRLGVNDPNDGRRANLLYQNDGAGAFTEVADAAGLRPLGQSWVMDFADIDNDGDFDAFLSNHDMPNILYGNGMGGDAVGVFTDISAAAGVVADLAGADFILQAHFEDFDNDGFVDLLASGSFGSQHRLLMNNGDGTFTDGTDALPNTRQMHSFAVGDLNNDGSPDILAEYGSGYNDPTTTPDVLLLNAGNDNNYFNVRLHGTDSNASGVGARLELNGAWGMQTREVRAGESYGITNSIMQHFGLADADEIESLVVYWPSGLEQTIENPDINQVLDVTEGCDNVFYEDADGDGAGNADASVLNCDAPKGYVDDDSDCDDEDENNYPDNEEVCDEADNNCDGEADEGDVCSVGSSSGGEETGDETTTSTTTGPATTSTTTTTAGAETGDETDGDTDDSAGSNDDDSGCGCDVDEPRSGGWLALFMLGLVPFARRRNRR